MRIALLLWGTLALSASPTLAQDRVYVPHITKEMQSRSRVAPRSDYTRGLTLNQMRERNARPANPAAQRHEAGSVAEQRRQNATQARSANTAENILGMRERNATRARSSAADLTQARQRHYEAQRQAQQDLARAALQRQKETRRIQSMDLRDHRDRAGEALRSQKRQSAARLNSQRTSGSTVFQHLTMAQRRLLNRR